MKKQALTYFSALCLCFFLACSISVRAQKPNVKKTKLDIRFAHYVDDDLLQLDSAAYVNELDQAFTVSKFKYYIGNLSLTEKNGSVYTCQSYFLIDEEKPNSKVISLDDIPDGEYLSVRFTIGVDSIDNCSGAQSGALDPINGMFWTWNTGYIFLKLEGSSAFASTPNAFFEYHIGGFKNPFNCTRQVSLPLDEPVLVSVQRKADIDIKADVMELLKTPTTIDFSKLPSVTDFNNSTMMADNYSDMFSVLTTK